MTFAKSYEPGEFESDIYAAWEAAGVFEPSLPKYPVDDNGDGADDREGDAATFSIVRPPPNAKASSSIQQLPF